MKISEIYRQKKTVISLEVFPPKITSPVETVYDTLDHLKELSPDFISVTYGAGGKAKDRTVEIAGKIKGDYGIESMAHLTCISSTKEQVASGLAAIRDAGIENILALRGDIPEDPDFEFPNPLQYQYARELIGEVKAAGGFSIGAACYPEGHVDSPGPAEDMEHLKEKVDCGADFLVSQLFFDNELFYDFMDRAAKAGISIPVSAGIMPVLNRNQILRMTKLSGCSVPAKLERMLDRYGDDPAALREAGEAYATEQIVELLAWGVRGIHLYTMNKYEAAKRIIGSIERIREK
ncbi:methylenetetrahydrofolate reductase [NAD(P)H] [Bacilliculturomica massiliensis]|uniref:methylenetetrahydrofolate reductase [NAD(P)H] n=1 Tax=Bacilliculturomica massiliensis TaxID=1917867 RepID=UPI00102FE2AC|nr:methylenetetrahydrofolate reductase [NAD(P)H] [Bacilliculturomica massiliensis]